MIIAVTYENGQVYEHFGHANQIKLYTVLEGKIEDTLLVECEQVNGHTAMSDLLKEHDVAVLICGNIGEGALEALAERQITVYPGVCNEADKAVEEFLQGKLSFNPDTLCNHHEASGSCGCGGSCGCSGGCGGCGGDMAEVELPPVTDFSFSNPKGGVKPLCFDDFENEVMGHGYPIIVNFGTSWAEPCKELATRFEELSHEYTNVKFCSVDCDEEAEIANLLQITNIPTMLIVKSNAIIDELIGAYPKEEIRKAIDRAISLEISL